MQWLAEAGAVGWHAVVGRPISRAASPQLSHACNTTLTVLIEALLVSAHINGTGGGELFGNPPVMVARSGRFTVPDWGTSRVARKTAAPASVAGFRDEQMP